jgi:REP element-mobilizing transposase RayT
MFHRRPHRLAAEVYRSGTFFLTLCTSDRRVLPADAIILLQTILHDEALRSAVGLDLYCFMPDHCTCW